MAKQCGSPRCARPHYSKGLCLPHYSVRRRGGDPMRPLRSDLTDEERFWAATAKSAPDDCWMWTAGRTADGYGQARQRGAQAYAHRFSYEMHNGPIPEGALVDHACRERACVNPRHLRLANASLNQQNRDSTARAGRSGVRGVHYFKRTGRWRASAMLNGKPVSMGSYATIEEAAQVVSDWRRQNMPYSEVDKRKERT